MIGNGTLNDNAMHAPNSLAAAAAAMLLSTVSAMPNLMPRQTDIALVPWVAVDDDGDASTVTPISSTVSGTPTVVSAAPADVTGSVVTISYYDSAVTSSGTPYPTPTGDVSGEFAVCSNKDGDRAPWCFPTEGAMLVPGKTYYFIWDAGYFTSNDTIRVEGNFTNTTTGENMDQAFKSSKLEAKDGFWTCNIEKDFMQADTNLTLQISVFGSGGNTTQTIEGPKLYVSTPVPYTSTNYNTPNGPALYIGLPTIFGFIIVCLVGTCIWNRKARHINIGNVMSRSRNGGGFPLGKKARLNKQRKANERIQLMQREVEAAGGEVYHDAPPRPRRGSDELGSLAGTPTEDRRMNFSNDNSRPGQEGNMFRNELKRQEGERFL